MIVRKPSNDRIFTSTFSFRATSEKELNFITERVVPAITRHYLTTTRHYPAITLQQVDTTKAKHLPVCAVSHAQLPACATFPAHNFLRA